MIDISDFKPLHQKYFKLMLVRRIVFSIILVTAFFVFYFTNKDKVIPSYVFVISIIALLLFIVTYISLTRIVFIRKKYLLNDTYLSYKKGLLIRQMIVVPFSRIQHIEIEEGPFERFFKLSTLSIYTAGDSGKDLKISGLKKEKAQEIKELITAYIKDE
ncbi:PH domain-containing protein [Flavobacteriales bacterium]|nr:PH domain-containing protein [Flavobacteriales bacterium]